jgi:LuxR family maltose regulon positive regulatory protein
MSGLEGALRSRVRDELATVGFAATSSKLYRPSPGVVSRSTLLGEVRASNADVVTVTAPAGYGKSTFVAELTAVDARPTAWVSLTATENDPASLLTYIALALDEIEPVDPGCVTPLWGRSPTIGTPELQRFAAMLGSRRSSFVLVLDDVHELVGRDVLDILAVLVTEMPPDSTIVLGSRRAIPLPLGRVRVRRRLVEVAYDRLAFDADEAKRLLDELGVDVGTDETARLVERTEGWPVALYLAALAHGTTRGAVEDVVDDFSGDHRYLVEYLGDELLGQIDPDVAAFLMHASCFERLSGTLCDDVLERRGSAALLEAVQRRNLLVIPLDDRREWYRFHHLMSTFLRTELARRDPARLRAIHRRASDWFHAHGDADGAVTHAVLSRDLARAEELVIHWFGRITIAGGNQTIERWVSMFSDDELVQYPGLMVSAAHARFGSGDAAGAVEWLGRGVAALPDRHPPDAYGPVAPVALAVTRAIIAPITPSEMAEEARYAYERVGLGEGHPLSCAATGAAAFMLGDEAEAVVRLREGAASTLDRPIVEATCLAHLAIIDIDHGRWEEASRQARRARVMLGDSPGPTSALVLAVSVLVETHAGRANDVELDRQRCRQHLTALLDVAPWLNVQARLALSRAALLRRNRVEAGALAEEAEAILATMPGAVRVTEQLQSLRRELATRDRTHGFGPSSLTTAELRVLQLLPTHLSVAEIAERLYVSRNTVKSQTISIYRKLGTSSRGGAVERAIASGLLEGAPTNP